MTDAIDYDPFTTLEADAKTGAISFVPVDVVLDAMAWGNLAISTTQASDVDATASQNVAGIAVGVTIRAAVSGGNLAAGQALAAIVNGTEVASIASGQSQMDFTVYDGDTLAFELSCSADLSSRTVTVTNQTNGGAAIDTFTIVANVAIDETPDAMDWANITIVTTASTAAAANPAKTVAGLELEPVTLRATLSAPLPGSCSLDVIVNGTTVVSLSSGFQEFSVSNTDTIAFQLNATEDVGSKTVTVTNTTDEGSVLDTFTVQANVSADETPDAINFADIAVATTAASGSGSNSNQTVQNFELTTLTLRAAVSSALGAGNTLSIIVNGTEVGSITGAVQTSQDFTVADGDVVHFSLSSTADLASKTVTVTNVTDEGTVLDTFLISANVSMDETPDAVDWADIALLTTAASGASSNSSNTIQSFEVDQITLRATVSSAIGASATLSILVNGTEVGSITGVSQTTQDFNVADGDTVAFELSASADLGAVTVTITNQTDEGATLDTFSVSADVLYVPPWYNPGAAISLDFENDQAQIGGSDVTSLSALLTVTNSGGTYRDSSGHIQAASSNAPRFSYIGGRQGLLIEEERTNLLSRSEDFGATWSKGYCVITDDDATSPRGTATADKMTDNAAGGSRTVSLQMSRTVDTLSQYTLSCFAKAGSVDYLYLVPRFFSSVSSSAYAYFNVSTGTVGSVHADLDDAGIEDYGNGWYRCWMVFTTHSSDTSGYYRLGLASADGVSTVTADGSNYLWVWGAQFEKGAVPSSYIYNASYIGGQTRTADDVSMTGIVTSGWYDQAVGSLYADARPDYVVSGQTIASFSDGTANEVIAVTAGADTHLQVIDGGAEQANIDAGTFVEATAGKIAAGWAANDFGAVIDGGAVVNDAAGAIPTTDEWHIGSRYDGAGGFLNGHLFYLEYFDSRQSDTALDALTA